jgi:hypothetical protein
MAYRPTSPVSRKAHQRPSQTLAASAAGPAMTGMPMGKKGGKSAYKRHLSQKTKWPGEAGYAHFRGSRQRAGA